MVLCVAASAAKLQFCKIELLQTISFKGQNGLTTVIHKCHRIHFNFHYRLVHLIKLRYHLIQLTETSNPSVTEKTLHVQFTKTRCKQTDNVMLNVEKQKTREHTSYSRLSLHPWSLH